MINSERQLSREVTNKDTQEAQECFAQLTSGHPLLAEANLTFSETSFEEGDYFWRCLCWCWCWCFMPHHPSTFGKASLSVCLYVLATTIRIAWTYHHTFEQTGNKSPPERRYCFVKREPSSSNRNEVLCRKLLYRRLPLRLRFRKLLELPNRTSFYLSVYCSIS